MRGGWGGEGGTLSRSAGFTQIGMLHGDCDLSTVVVGGSGLGGRQERGRALGLQQSLQHREEAEPSCCCARVCALGEEERC